MDLILAEQLLLLLLDDDKGADTSWYGADPGLAGALLLDLTAAGALDERDGALVATGFPPGHPLLAAAHRAVAGAEKRRDAQGWVDDLPKELKPLRTRLAGGLVDRGVLSEARRKVLGIFHTTRFPQADPRPEQELREGLRAVLMGERTPTAQQAMLVALLRPYDLIAKLVPKHERKAAKERAETIAAGGTAGEAVAEHLRGIESALLAASIATTAVATTSAASGS